MQSKNNAALWGGYGYWDIDGFLLFAAADRGRPDGHQGSGVWGLRGFSGFIQRIRAGFRRNAFGAGGAFGAWGCLYSRHEPAVRAAAFSLSVRQREDALKLLEKVLRQGRLLGAKRLVFHGPARLRGAVRNAEYKRIGPIVSELAEMAGLTAFASPGKRELVPVFLSRIRFDIMPHHQRQPRLHAGHQAGRALRPGSLRVSGSDGRHACHVHLCDYDLSKPDYGLCLPGKGTFDFSRLFETLRARDTKARR